MISTMIAIASHRSDRFFLRSTKPIKMKRKMTSAADDQINSFTDVNMQSARDFDNQVTSYFLDNLFGDSVCLSKMDFIIML